MDEREKIIREDYPVGKLPADLREGLGDVAHVRVTLEPAPQTLSAVKKRGWTETRALIDELHRSPGFKSITSDEAVARVRTLRNEWDR